VRKWATLAAVLVDGTDQEKMLIDEDLALPYDGARD